MLSRHAFVFVALLSSSPAVVTAQATKPEKPKPIEVFGDTKVWQFHLTIDPKEYEAMQPPAGGGRGFGFPPPPVANPAPKQPGDREIHRSVFGTDFPVVHGAISTEGNRTENVALRYKGNSTYLSTARSLKRSIKVDVDHFDENARFLGLKTLNLHCGVMDPSKTREALAYAVYRAAGVPAPRTAFAEVMLTVQGKYDKEYVGLYTLTEQVNKSFLKAHYKTDKGLLMKPERVASLNYLGDNWDAYKNTYQPKRDATKDETERVIAFTRLVNRGTDEQFAKEIGSYIDVDAFLRFLAVTALTANLDSFFTNGHNYYLYLHPETNQFHFIPWDVDLSMGNFALFGTADQQMDLSLTKPYGGQCRLADRLMAVKGVAEKYQVVVKEVAAKAFDKEWLLQQVAAIEQVVKPLIAKESKAVAAQREGGGGGFGPPGAGAFGANLPDLKTFVQKRSESIAAQLSGKSKGFVPQPFGFGAPGGGFGPPGGGFGPGNQLSRPLLEAMDTNKDGKVSEDEFGAGMKKFFSDWDTNKNGTLEQQEISSGLQKLLPQPKGPMGFGPPKGP